MFIPDISKLKFHHTFYKCFLNPFLANVPILYPLKTPENQRGGGYKMGTLARNRLIFVPLCISQWGVLVVNVEKITSSFILYLVFGGKRQR